MIILIDDTLTHVDSSLDVLEHYGVKGMKWGVIGRGRRKSAKFNSAVKKAMVKRGLGDGTFSADDDIMKKMNKYEKDFEKVGNELILKNPKYKNMDRINKLLDREDSSRGIYSYNKDVRTSGSKAYQTAKKVGNMFDTATGISTGAASIGITYDKKSVYQPSIVTTLGSLSGKLVSYGVKKGIERGITRDIRKQRRREANEIKTELKRYV